MDNKVRSTVFILLMATSAIAAEVHGKWTFEQTSPAGSTRMVTLNLKPEGDKLKGTVSMAGGDTSISDGKVDGDKISFAVKREVGGQTRVTTFKGLVDKDTLKLEITGQRGEPVKVTARRCPPDCP